MSRASRCTTCSTTWCVTFLVWEPNCAMTKERSGSSLTSTSIRKIFAFCMAHRRRYRTAMKSPLSQRWQVGSGKVSLEVCLACHHHWGSSSTRRWSSPPPSCKEVTMKRSYFPRQCWALLGILVVMTLLFALSASAQTPSIEGTWQFVSRTLPDGTVLKPPDMMGLFTYTKTHRNVNVVRKDATGKFSSTSSVSTYKLTATEYSET